MVSENYNSGEVTRAQSLSASVDAPGREASSFGPKRSSLCLWDEETVPHEADDEFQTLIQRKRLDGEGQPRAPPFEPPIESCAIWADAPNPSRCHASFGAQGTTATAGVYGNLLQISQYLGVGKSGVFSLDHEDTDEPYFVVGRAECLASLSASTDGIGMRVMIVQDYVEPRDSHELYDRTAPSNECFIDLQRILFRDARLPQFSWVFGKWPRYVYTLPEHGLRVTIQFMIHDHLVLQHWVVENSGESDITLSCCLPGTSTRIRDHDSLDGQFRFNEPGSAPLMWQSKGPRGYGICSIAPFDESMNGASEGPTHKKAGDESECDSIIAVTGLFLNGSATQINAEGRLQRSITLSGKAPSTSRSSADFAQFTAAFKLMHLPRSKAHFRNFLISSEDADVDNILKDAKKDTTPPFDLSTISLDEVPLQTSTTGATEFTSRNATLGDEKSMHQENGSEKIGGAEGPRLPTASRTIGFPSSVPAKSSPESHIEFVTWRHLEHILGVCAIPLVTPRLWEDPFKAEIPENMPGDVVPIALTCGDLSGHRICHSASFFAFEFLIETAKKLQRICSNYSDVKPVLDRIQVVCKGHLEWLCQAELTEEGVFAANYKVAGRLWRNIAESNTWMPDDSLTDTPFQIIKAAHYYAVFSENDLAQTLVDRVQNGVLCSLSKFDPRHKLVWPHREENEVNVFRLDDQVWIWTAIKAAHDTEPSLWRFPGRNKNTVNMAIGQPVSETKIEIDAAIILTHSGIQRAGLQRFTTVNDVSGKRMLAVMRSLYETRFLLHARDTALFYGLDAGYFLRDSAFHDLWENTIESQRHHEHNQEATWENALRYALAIVVGTRDRSLNNKIPKDLVMDSIEVLLRSTGSNAFFPGELEVTTKKPVLFGTEQDREYYFHASFEIPYVLLTDSHRINSLCESSYPSKLSNAAADTRDSRVTHNSNQQAMEAIELATAQPKHQPQLESVQRPVTVPTRQAGDSRMKKTLPFSNIKDTSSVVEIEEEWLFNYPTFFSRHSRPDSDVDANLDLKDWVKEGGVIDQAAKMHVSYRAFQNTLDLECKESQYPTSFIVDIPKQKYRGKRQKRSEEERPDPIKKINKDLWSYLKLQRTEKGAKKRLLQLSSPNALTALLCFLATPDDLKENLSQFFDRHFEYVQYFQDGPFLIFNRWKTEIHLSFYALADADVMDKPGRAIPERSTCIYAFPGNENLEIRRYAVGLIFDGDFFDRYWTCHYIMNAPDTHREELDKLPKCVATEKRFQQRRYIEICIILSTLEMILASSHKILDQVQKFLGIENQGFYPFSIDDSSDYASRAAQWENIEPILARLEEEVSSTTNTISRWENRERDRGRGEQPHWSRNDERKYRKWLNIGNRSAAVRIAELRDLQNKIKLLEMFIEKNLNWSRESLTFRSNENIIAFTYVTVIFLPLGFAVSIFSMSDSPPGANLWRMVICSVVALALTVLLLLNARGLMEIASAVSGRANQYSTARMKTSLIVPKARDESDPEDSHNESGGLKKTPKLQTSSWHLWFWFSHLLVELPARRILRAFRAVPNAHMSQLTNSIQKKPEEETGRQQGSQETLGEPHRQRQPSASRSIEYAGKQRSRRSSFGFGSFHMDRHDELYISQTTGKTLWTRIATVITGFVMLLLFLPVFVPFWVGRIILYNILDVLRLLGGWIERVLLSDPADLGSDDARRILWLAYPPEMWRPIKKLNDKMQEKRAEKDQSQANAKKRGSRDINNVREKS